MLAFLTRIVLALRSVLDGRASREAEILALRQQLMVLGRKSRKRVRLRNIDRLILVWLYRIFPSVLEPLSWLSRRPSFAGTAEASKPTGTGSLAGSGADPRSIVRSGI